MVIGEYLAKIFMKVLEDFKIENKLFCITTDNAANMGKMMDHLEHDYLNTSGFQKEKNWISCLSHMLNLSVQAMLKNGLKSEAPGDSQNVFGISEELENNDSNIIENPINKLRRGIIKIR